MSTVSRRRNIFQCEEALPDCLANGEPFREIPDVFATSLTSFSEVELREYSFCIDPKQHPQDKTQKIVTLPQKTPRPHQAMLKQFLEFIQTNALIKPGEKTLLAVSGGMDSMAMVELFRQSPYAFEIAHCNFQLRGAASDKDQALVEETAQKMGIQCFIQKFDTTTQAQKHKESIQMAARTLRYEWLETIRKESGCQHIATAHHTNDAIETLLINLIRGTGIAGLKGIPVKAGNIIRPLLFASRKEIETFIGENNIVYREDQSNQEEKYRRNKIRHRILPLMVEINPALDKTMRSFFRRMEETHSLTKNTIRQAKTEWTKQQGEEFHISMDGLKEHPAGETILFELLNEFGFSPATCEDIYKGMDAQPGKMHQAPEYKLIRDRETLIVVPRAESTPPKESHILPQESNIECGQQQIRIETGKTSKDIPLKVKKHQMIADFEKLHFPLLLRPWQPGDAMVPYGMKGKKKVSDLITEARIPIHKKKDIFVMVSNNEIMWLVGIRAAAGFEIENRSRNYWKASLEPI